MSARRALHPFITESRKIATEAGYPDEVLKAFRAHFFGSKSRNIPFLFTISEWWLWWQTDDRWNSRGPGGQDFVMARFNDQGPYSPDNVYCATHAQNGKDIGRERRSEFMTRWWYSRERPHCSKDMSRETIRFTAPQFAYLRAEAAKLGISLADLVRRIIDQHREAS